MLTSPSEDAPALDAIHTFKTEVKDGKIIVTADAKKTLKDNKSRVPKLSTDGVVTPGEDLLIIGGGAGTIHAVESLREVCFSHTSPHSIITNCTRMATKAT